MLRGITRAMERRSPIGPPARRWDVQYASRFIRRSRGVVAGGTPAPPVAGPVSALAQAQVPDTQLSLGRVYTRMIGETVKLRGGVPAPGLVNFDTEGSSKWLVQYLHANLQLM